MFIAILFFVFSFISYFRKKHDLFVFGLTVLLTNAYYLAPSDPSFKYLATALVVAISFFELLRNVTFFNCKGDGIGKIIILLLLLFLVNCIGTIIFQIETPVSALKVLYNNLFFVSYFIFRRFDVNVWERSLKYILFFTIIGGAFYYLQFVGIHVLSGIVQEEYFGKTDNRYMNYPTFSYLFLFYFLFSNKKHKYYYLVFFIPFIVLPMSRGAMLGVILAIFAFLFIKHRLTKSLLKISIPIIIALFAFMPIIQDRFIGKSNEVSFGDEISNVLKWKSYSDFKFGDNDTYAFRIALTWERLEYMFDNPHTLLTGIGSIYENTPACRARFNFQIGSWSVDSNGDAFARQIETTDIAFITHLLRYGILYIVFMISLLILCYRRFKSNDSIWADVALLFLLYAAIVSSASSPFYDFSIHRMFPILFFSGILYQKRASKMLSK